MTDRRKAARRLLAVIASLGVLAGLVAGARFAYGYFTAPLCQVTAGGTTLRFTPEQTHHAATIAAIAGKRGLPARAATIAIATAIQESGLRNITYGDRDSLGLFQQRPSQGWGTETEVLDPVHATNAFYDALVKVDDYESREITVVAQQVQRSAYPAAYADHEAEGRVLASNLTGHSPASLGCRLEGSRDVTDVRRLTGALATELGVTGALEGAVLSIDTATQTQAWAVASWAVAQAQAHGLREVVVAGRHWSRGSGRGALEWGTMDVGRRPTAVSITVSR